MYKYAHGGDIYSSDLVDKKMEILDFSANINPLGLPEGVKNALINAVDDCINYPDPFCRELRNAIAEKLQLSEAGGAKAVYCGNGAADVLFRLFQTIKPAGTLLTAPSFSDYAKAAEASGSHIEYHYLLEENNFTVDASIIDSINEKDINMLVLCSPNNPTGQLINPELLHEILRLSAEKGIYLLVDECFLDFVEEGERYSLVSELPQYKNLIVLKAFTKTHGMPGVRLGYCLSSDEELLEKVRECGQDWNVSTLAQAGGMAALAEDAYMEKSLILLKNERDFMLQCLKDMGMKIYGSAADFIFFYSPYPETMDAFLRERGILIRNCSNYPGLKQGFYRVAIKKHRHNEKLCTIMGNFIKQCDHY